MSEAGPSTSQSEPDAAPVRVMLGEDEIGSMSLGEWATCWRRQDSYVSTLERRLTLQEGDLENLRQSLEKSRSQLNESQMKERVLVRRLTIKEQETQDLVCQLNVMKQAQAASSLRNTLVDPAVNCMILELKAELDRTRSKLEDTQNELTAWKFTPDSNTGKRLMAKCRLLYQENEELGKITSSGRIAKLESDLALQKSFAEEVRQSQNELDSFLADLDEDVEGMQSTILFLQSELRKSKETTQALQKELGALKISSNGKSNGESVCEAERTDSEEDNRTTCVKRARRASVLSIDYNEDDALVIGNGAAGSDQD